MARTLAGTRTLAGVRTAANNRSAPFNFLNSLRFNASTNQWAGAAVPAPVQVPSKTIEFWYNLNTLPTGSEVLLGLAASNYYVAISLKSFFYSYADAGSVQRTAFITMNNFKVGFWQHVAYTFDVSGSNVTVTIYSNGVQVGSTTRTDGYLSAYGGVLDMAVFSSGSLNYDGRITNLKFYNTALSAADVLLRYRNLPASVAVTEEWNFSEGSGGTLTGSAGTQFILVNTPTWQSTDMPMELRTIVT